MHTVFACSLLQTMNGKRSVTAAMDTDVMAGMFNLVQKRIEYVRPSLNTGPLTPFVSISGDGFRIRCGEDTIVLLAVGRWIQAKNSRPGEEIMYIDGARPIKKRITEVGRETAHPSVSFSVQDGYGLIVDGVVVR